LGIYSGESQGWTPHRPEPKSAANVNRKKADPGIMSLFEKIEKVDSGIKLRFDELHDIYSS